MEGMRRDRETQNPPFGNQGWGTLRVIELCGVGEFFSRDRRLGGFLFQAE
jgi:hypothetical protein